MLFFSPFFFSYSKCNSDFGFLYLPPRQNGGGSSGPRWRCVWTAFCKGGSGIFGFHRVWRCLSAALYFIRNQSLTLQENSPVSTQSHQQGFSLKENLTKCKRRVWKEEASFESCAVPGLFASNFALCPHANGSLLAVTPQKKDLTFLTTAPEMADFTSQCCKFTSVSEKAWVFGNAPAVVGPVPESCLEHGLAWARRL